MNESVLLGQRQNRDIRIRIILGSSILNESLALKGA